MARLIGFLACTQRRNEKNENISKSLRQDATRERDSPEKKGGPRRIAWRGGDGDGARGTGLGQGLIGKVLSAFGKRIN